ncbi:hypothetical protein COE80_03080 [Bacillus pseudomycoides]|uniref:hypothetical protein n=1 Tax=Bacillus pseudomycoides TaxID=64104 RepID=UPI0002F7DA78|nr:hypothetical protein [Bacillus pseudomycoides]PEJ21555.1 hypothetical protein CN887_24955 [Bacillus pseudomycoides]PGC40833.1 hypothetical protein COM18_13590 [Bacillus pseudomycoides]PHB30804.1 hypothetical protein COE80_03080 [Bacillus pseudomycoides]
MKTYTGFEAIERMKTDWIKEKNDCFAHTLKKGKHEVLGISSQRIVPSAISINFFFENEFEDYVEPLNLEEGEMFVIESLSGKWYGILKEETQEKYYLIMGLKVGDYRFYENGCFFKKYQESTFRKATDEELEEFERFMMFYKKDRKMDEFKLGDICERKDVLYKVIVQTEDNKFEGVLGCVAINEKDAPVKYFPANSVELQFCVEDMVG